MNDLLDKLAIHEAILRYARAVDRSDWESVRAAYHTDAHDDHGEFKGSVNDLISWLVERFAGAQTGIHFVGNCLVDVVATDIALAETYFVSHRLQSPVNVTELAECGPDGAYCRQGWGRYIDRFERREDRIWRVAQRTVVMDSIVKVPVRDAKRSGTAVWGRRDEGDWLFQAMKQLSMAKS